MGLDFSHCDAHWSYSGFNRFRSRICDELGISWNGLLKNNRKDPDWQKLLNSKNGLEKAIEFANTGVKVEGNIDPIIHILNHSDCDGSLSPRQCRELAPRLKEIVKRWPSSDFDRHQAEKLIKGLESAAESNEELEFM